MNWGEVVGQGARSLASSTTRTHGDSSKSTNSIRAFQLLSFVPSSSSESAFGIPPYGSWTWNGDGRNIPTPSQTTPTKIIKLSSPLRLQKKSRSQHQVYFVHLGKTGGETVRQILKYSCRLSTRLWSLSTQRKCALQYSWTSRPPSLHLLDLLLFHLRGRPSICTIPAQLFSKPPPRHIHSL
jgi:hypothetical protein